MSGADREDARASLRRALEEGDLEGAKRAADSHHQAGGDPVAALRVMALNELQDDYQRSLALQALEHLDSDSAKSVADRLRISSGRSPTESWMPEALIPSGAKDRARWWISGPLLALAILWPAHSIYRFHHPKVSDPPNASDPPPSISPWTNQDAEAKARSACKSAVRQRLRDPESADFPFLAPAETESSYNGEIKVRGYLHARNGLGLKVRLGYQCRLQVETNARAVSMLDTQLFQR